MILKIWYIPRRFRVVFIRGMYPMPLGYSECMDSILRVSIDAARKKYIGICMD